MADHIIQVFTATDRKDDLVAIADRNEAMAYWSIAAGRGSIVFHILSKEAKLQSLIDQIQTRFTKNDDWHLIVETIEVYLPTPKEPEEEKASSTEHNDAATLRESMERELSKNANLDRNYLLLVAFSTLVAAIGMAENNVAVIIGAMVIAPFLGPNLALTFAAAMGNTNLAAKAVKTLFAGSLFAYVLGVLVSQFWQFQEIPLELEMRTSANYSSIVLALASGAAAALSLTNGIASVLVGVMVAVALLPPLTASALFIGHGHIHEALSALLLLAINIICINLSGLLMFILRGIGPRTWWEKRKARRSVYVYIAAWIFALVCVSAIIWWRH